MPTPRVQHTPNLVADASDVRLSDDLEESQEISVPLNAGFFIPPGPSRPYGWLRTDAGEGVPLRLARIGTRVIEVVPEVVGLEQFDGQVCVLAVEGLPTSLRGVFRFRSDGSAHFRITRLDRLATQQLFEFVQRTVYWSPPTDAEAPGEQVLDEARILSILWGLVGSGVPARVRANRRDWLLRADEICGQTVVWNLLERGGAPTSPFVIEASGYSAGYELSVLLVSESADKVITTLPRAIQRFRRRRFPRASGHEDLRVQFRHPDFDLMIDAPIRDLSDAGLGFYGSPSEDLLCPGLWVPSCRVMRGPREIARLSLEFRTVDFHRSHVGVVVHADPAEQARWHAVVRAALHDRTRTQGFDPLALWELYESSGYFNLGGKDPDDFQDLKLRFQAGVRKLRSFPELGYHVVWPSPDGLDAAVTNMLVYSRAHVGYHMAKRPGRVVSGVAGKEMLRDIHWHLLEEALAYGHADWWIGYVQTSTRFSNLLMPHFQAAHRDPLLECVVPVHVYEFATTDAVRDPRFEAPTQEDIHQLVAFIQRTRPLPYWKSQDFTAEELLCPTIRAAWARAEFERDRMVLIARGSEGDVDAAMIMDLGHPGLHVYGLFDLARFYALAPDGEKYLPAMLETARAMYAERGRKVFKFFHESSRPLPAEVVADRCIDMGGASLCVISMRLIPDLLDYLFEQMTWDPADSLPPVARRTKPPSAFPKMASSQPSSPSRMPPPLTLPPNPKTPTDLGD